MEFRKPRVTANDTPFVRRMKESILYLYQQVERQRVLGDGATFRVTETPGGRIGHAEGGGEREIDGSIDNAAGVDVSNVADLKINVYHRSATVELSETISTNTYWLKVDLSEPNSGSAENACSIETSDPSGADVLAYKLLTVDPNDKATLYRGAWTEVDDNVNLRFGTVVTPDVAQGTCRLWNKAVNLIPLGWGVCSSAAGKFIVGYSAVDGDYDFADTGGYKWHGKTENNHGDHLLGHKHAATASICTGDGFSSSFVSDQDDVDDWTGSANGADTKPVGAGSSSIVEHKGTENNNQDTDNRPPYYTFVIIERRA